MVPKKCAAAIIGLVMVAGCEPPPQQYSWHKPGATEATYNVENYQCMKESQQQTSDAYLDYSGGFASSGQSTNGPLHYACMKAKGWSVQRGAFLAPEATLNKAEADDAFKANNEKQQRRCADPKFAPYYSKTACSALGISSDQLADTSKISPGAKTILPEIQASVDVLTYESLYLHRKYRGTVGAKRFDLYMSTAKIQNDKNNSDLYEGQITWGEYNRRRQNIARQYQDAVSKLTS